MAAVPSAAPPAAVAAAPYAMSPVYYTPLRVVSTSPVSAVRTASISTTQAQLPMRSAARTPSVATIAAKAVSECSQPATAVPISTMMGAELSESEDGDCDDDGEVSTKARKGSKEPVAHDLASSVAQTAVEVRTIAAECAFVQSAPPPMNAAMTPGQCMVALPAAESASAKTGANAEAKGAD
eukprot:TRINITY_DN37010_c0_g1_i1.p1 TRINITY_DN37010_c0_g1~~TRINITY_DN37010_c0_g1_i1.p1  ORF type:complete len:192 (-),score=42.12 TRINITY_DN37010_c0_g1_i1:28-573(-)